jgi:hypothetical protein
VPKNATALLYKQQQASVNVGDVRDLDSLERTWKSGICVSANSIMFGQHYRRAMQKDVLVL